MNGKHYVSSRTLRFAFLLLVCGALTGRVIANPDLRFDVVTFCCSCTNSMLCQTQFDHLNFPSANGHYIAMGSDTYRAEVETNGNVLAIYYNSFDTAWTNYTSDQMAATIDQYSTNLFTTTGPRPNW